MAQYQPTISDTMRSNISIILNDNSSKESQNRVGIKIKEYPVFANYSIECVFRGIDAKGKKFEIKPIEINRFLIDQNFSESYMNHIEINVSMRPLEFLTIYDGYQNLKCDITLYHANPTTGEVKGIDFDGEPVKVFSNYRVIFKNKEDIRKKIPKKSLIPEDGGEYSIEQQDMLFTDISLQLIEDIDYKLRVTSFSFQLTESTVKDAILFMAHSCKIDTVAFVPPENETIIPNIIIPPIHTFQTALDYIQEIYGVYSNGLGYYYSEGVLYIYPKYDTNPMMPIGKDEDVPNLYFIGGVKFPNLEVNHAVDIYNTTHIVINAANINKDQVDVGIENDGTGILMMHADRVIDSWRSMDEARGADAARIGLGQMNIHKTPNTSLFSLTNCERKTIGIDPNISIIKYMFDEANPYKQRLPINRYKRTTINTAWENATPFTFKPGYRIVWNYDGEAPENRDAKDSIASSLMYCSKTGVVDSVAYRFTPTSRLNNRYIFKCIAPLEMTIKMDVTDPDDNMTSSSDIDESTANKVMGGGSAYKLSMARGGGGCPLDRLYKELKAKDPSQLTKNEKMILEGLEKRLEEKRQRLMGNGTIFR